MATKTRSRGKAKMSELDLERNSNEMTLPSHLSTLVMLSQQLLSIGRFNKGLPSFISKGVDSEQIWQQLELRNDHQLSLSKCTREVVQISSRKRVKREKKIEEKVTAEVDEEKDSDSENESSSDSDVENTLDAIKTRLAQKSEDDDELLDFASSDDDEENDFDFEMETGKSKESKIEDIDKIRAQLKKKSSKKSSAVDDKFFKLADMEEFLDAEDLKEEKKNNKEGNSNRESQDDEDSDDEDDEEIDMFAADSDSEDTTSEANARYSDFFDPPEGDDDESNKENEESDDAEDDTMEKESDEEEEKDEEMEVSFDEEVKEEVDDSPKDSKKVSFSNDLLGSDEEKPDVEELDKKATKSSFEQKQEKLLRKAREMEELSLQEPSWELTGEVMSSKRPQNSLLETVMDFQHTTRAAPVITDDTTNALEDFIKQRIKDKTFDDVERKEKPKEDVFEFKKRIVLDQEKSKQSLAEIYEQEFIKQKEKESDEVKADPQCEKIEKDLNKLFFQLDALSNFRYTPMKPGTEVKIVVNTPAITMEEVAPVATANADMLAPEEIMAKRKGDLKADEERDDTDKKRARRQKKLEKREKKKAKESREKKVEKLKPGLGNKYSKEKALKKLEELSKSDKTISLIKDGKRQLGSSSAFFSQLQDQVAIQGNTGKAAKGGKKEKKKVDAGKLIL